MRLLQHIRHFFQRRAIQRLLQQQLPRQEKLRYNDMRAVGILFDASELQHREQVLHFADKLRQQGKKVSLLGFFDHEVARGEFTFPIFTQRDFDWGMRPGGDALRQFLDMPLDLLIHADTHSQNLYATGVLAASKAKLRAGPYAGQIECYELMADISGSTDLPYLLGRLEFLLEKTNLKQYEAA